VTLFYPYEELKQISKREQVLSLFETYFAEALELIGRENLLHDFFENPASPLVTVKVTCLSVFWPIYMTFLAAEQVQLCGQGAAFGRRDPRHGALLRPRHERRLRGL
jgi:kynurenine 3-monooxygenase